MRRSALRPLSHLALGALAAGAVLYSSGLDRALVLDAYLVFAGAVVLHALARATARVARPKGESVVEAAVRRPRPDTSRPDALLRLEGMVSLASATASDFHLGLRPHLREIAAHRLRSRLGLDLDGEPERARDALGEDAWRLLRRERPEPEERFAPGPSRATLSAVVSAIERIPE